MDEDKAVADTVVTGDVAQIQTGADQLPILPAAGVITVGRRGTGHKNALRLPVVLANHWLPRLFQLEPVTRMLSILVSALTVEKLVTLQITVPMIC